VTISTLLQTQLIDTIGSVVITDITQDPVTSNYVRQIRVYAPPDASGNVALVFTLQLSAVAQSSIELTAPAALF
jgi:hypothetical protein